jgi:protein-tyrosine-phosphatase
MRVHFICRGNVYRSRIAEAYLKSLELEGLEVLSSGTIARERSEFTKPIAESTLKFLCQNTLGPTNTRSYTAR